MTRRCDRCRAPYESGADLGGHDYCMTCYAQLKQEEMRKHLEEEQQRQRQLDAKKHFLHMDYMAQDKARLLRSRDEKAEEERRQDSILQATKKREAEEQLRKKKKWDDKKPKNRVIGEELQIFTPLGRKKKPMPAIAPKKKDEGALDVARIVQRRKDDAKKKKPPASPLAQASLSLSVAESLPVSLSVGQKQVQLILLGKNASSKPIAVGVEASVLDSQKSAIACKAEPRTLTIEPEGESKIKVAFDLPEDAARGPLSFTAILKENAIYIDKQAAQSNAVSLSSQVKSPMNLQYRQGSAANESGKLSLTFDNVGESGGILETSSTVTCFSQESVGKKAALASRTKVKGGEKNILLTFAPADAAGISRMELSLIGTDSNGKPYSLKRKINGKDAPAEEGENKTESG